MIVISGSMPKSGSTWLYSMTDAALVADGYRSAEEVRDRYRLHGVLVSKANEISYATPSKLLRLIPAHAMGEAVLCKTHFAPSRSLRALMAVGTARGTYIYRDLRDVALSAMNHGERARAGGHGHELKDLRTVEDALRYAAELYIPEWERWSSTQGLLMLRYEQMLVEPELLMRRVADHLGLDLDDGALAEIVARFDRRQLQGTTKQNLMLNKATSGRYLDEMTAGQRALAKDLFGRELEAMGYAA
ncbi:sulfotransferase domain-containing protein [Mucisphaera calidilacus]|uniref:Sulfotransferase domain protein n=1 Tax=Mucisphaera calidilacus TaxID=2527982 RepID=A0A518BX85_9BACT|nr:sulfotransferase domain-containing protein [Mucisphaera calidilacus]QDU71586.1 Sulfotransferase domain protein [Mucisphaera calidilacus]